MTLNQLCAEAELRRIHWFEIHDQPWFPTALRDAVTDLLEFALYRANNYGVIVPRLRRALTQANTNRIVDLCSGGGGPWPRIASLFAAPQANHEVPFEICLTDKFPNREALARARALSHDQIAYRADSVDAMAVPSNLCGFRTLFTSFHHFRPTEAQAILRDAVSRREGIGIFEVPHRSLKAVLLFCLTPLGIILLVPFMRPFRWSRLLWTYLVPVIPFVGLHDGIVSCMRAYSPEDLREMTKNLTASYTWEAGEDQGPHSPLPITYLIGVPAKTQCSSQISSVAPSTRH